MQLDHERLDVYDLALEFLVLANGIIEELPRLIMPSMLFLQQHWGWSALPARAAARGARGPSPRHKPRPTKQTGPTIPHGPSGTGTAVDPTQVLEGDRAVAELGATLRFPVFNLARARRFARRTIRA
jgi:hypothetical protein